MARTARTLQEKGLVPLLEPAVLAEGDHTIERAAEVQERVYVDVFRALAENGVFLEGCLLKPMMSTPGTSCPEAATPELVAAYSVRTLERTVPSAVPGVCFNSGTLGEEEASLCLDAIIDRAEGAWSVTFGFSSSLQTWPPCGRGPARRQHKRTGGARRAVPRTAGESGKRARVAAVAEPCGLAGDVSVGFAGCAPLARWAPGKVDFSGCTSLRVGAGMPEEAGSCSAAAHSTSGRRRPGRRRAGASRRAPRPPRRASGSAAGATCGGRGANRAGSDGRLGARRGRGSRRPRGSARARSGGAGGGAASKPLQSAPSSDGEAGFAASGCEARRAAAGRWPSGPRGRGRGRGRRRGGGGRGGDGGAAETPRRRPTPRPPRPRSRVARSMRATRSCAVGTRRPPAAFCAAVMWTATAPRKLAQAPGDARVGPGASPTRSAGGGGDGAAPTLGRRGGDGGARPGLLGGGEAAAGWALPRRRRCGDTGAVGDRGAAAARTSAGVLGLPRRPGLPRLRRRRGGDREAAAAASRCWLLRSIRAASSLTDGIARAGARVSK